MLVRKVRKGVWWGNDNSERSGASFCVGGVEKIQLKLFRSVVRKFGCELRGAFDLIAFRSVSGLVVEAWESVKDN